MTTLFRKSFAGCPFLKKIFIFENIIKIGKDCFRDCKSLLEIHLLTEDPNSIEVSFSKQDVEEITLFVPVGTGYAFRHHPEFSKFKEVKIESKWQLNEHE